MEEVWRNIKGYKNYQVSNLGNVKSLNYNHTGKEKLLKQRLSHNGYYRVGLVKNNKQIHYQVHRLVYEAFYGKIPFWMQVNHINENKTDNNRFNLNVLTAKDNTNWGTGVERSHKDRRVPIIQFDLNNNIVKEFSSITEVEKELGFCNSNIVRCCKGRTKTAYGYKWKYKEVG